MAWHPARHNTGHVLPVCKVIIAMKVAYKCTVFVTFIHYFHSHYKSKNSLWCKLQRNHSEMPTPFYWNCISPFWWQSSMAFAIQLMDDGNVLLFILCLTGTGLSLFWFCRTSKNKSERERKKLNKLKVSVKMKKSHNIPFVLNEAKFLWEMGIFWANLWIKIKLQKRATTLIFL